MAIRGSRWQSSVVTFGPVGRLVLTAFVLVVLWWSLFRLGAWGLAFTILWLGFMPFLLRHIWRPALLPPTDESRLQERLARELDSKRRPRPDHLAIDPKNEPPTRW